uniref:HTH_48 domain-containing protein n=1 Tax=Heterorhabditis bacteriophora TaxID=37862 RepID=A0A1I7WLW3_HETBA
MFIFKSCHIVKIIYSLFLAIYATFFKVFRICEYYNQNITWQICLLWISSKNGWLVVRFSTILNRENFGVSNAGLDRTEIAKKISLQCCANPEDFIRCHCAAVIENFAVDTQIMAVFVISNIGAYFRLNFHLAVYVIYHVKAQNSSSQFICITSKWDVKQWKLLAILTTQHWCLGFRNGDERLEDEEGGRRPLAIDDGQLRAIVEADPCKTTREVAEELNVDHSTVVRHLHEIGKSTKVRQMGAARAERIPKKSLLRNTLCVSLAQQERAIS